MSICVYCGKEKKIEELTQEHVIPRAIGGNLIPSNPFSLNDVCRRCNSISGTYIDGPFIKNWLTQNCRTEVMYKYADVLKDPILPLRYMGQLKGMDFDDNICELWLGPTGDSIYHFHKPYPEETDVPQMVGVPTYVNKKIIDNGFAFIFVRSNNPNWHKTILYSFVEQFKNSILYLGNCPTPKGGRFSDIPSEFKNLHDKLKSMSGKKHSISMNIAIDYGDRFLAKVALGVGALFLNKTFITSKDADLLRNAMWTKNSQIRSNIQIRGSGCINELNDNLKKILNWQGGHTIAIINDGKNLNLYLSFYETQCAVISLTSEPEHWEGRNIGDGIIFVISPGLQRFVGPKNIATYIAHKIEPDLKDHELLKLEKLTMQYKELPPFDI